MGLFKNRYLCLFMCIFMISSACCAYSFLAENIYSFVFVSVAALVFLVLSVLIKRAKVAFVAVFLCLLSAILAMTNFYFRVRREQIEAEKYDGSSYTALMHITEVNYISDKSSAFDVKIEQIGFDDVSVKARLVCMFPADLDVGDTLQAEVELSKSQSRNKQAEILLEATLYDTTTARVGKFQRDIPLYEMLFKKNGIAVATDMATDFISERLDMLLGSVTGSLAKGFLLGDTSDISVETVRNFRRTGLSHLFAVSGMHITLLLGTVDIILQKLYIHKYIRCICITLLTFPMLLMTGFAMSAVRSVLMLLIVYLFLVFKEVADTPTTLFTSITVIILLFPYSVYDLGMWMSFLATLGIITVYVYAEEAIPRPVMSKGAVKYLLRSLRAILLAAILTVVCNVFLLPIEWYVFGEISLISVLANIPLAPLSSIFMIGIILVMIFGSVPLLGSIVAVAVKGVGVAIYSISSVLAKPTFATVSLRYFFADILVIGFTVAFVILLAVELRKKWLVFVPVISFVAAFGICVAMYHAISIENVTYYVDGKSELISASDNGKLSVVDNGRTTYIQYKQALQDGARQGATSVDSIIFTELNESRATAVDYFMHSNMVDKICMPYPKDEQEYDIIAELAAMAEECGTKVVIYENAEQMFMGSLIICVDRSENEGTDAFSVFVSDRENLFAYADPLVFDGNRRDLLHPLFSKSDVLLVGNRHTSTKPYYCLLEDTVTLIYSSEDVYMTGDIRCSRGCLINKDKKIKIPMD